MSVMHDLTQSYAQAKKRLNGGPINIPIQSPQYQPTANAGATEAQLVALQLAQIHAKLISLKLTRPQAFKIGAMFHEFLQGFIVDRKSLPITTYSIAEILNLVASVESVDIGDICSERRSNKISGARHLVCYLACKYTAFSTTTIGKHLGGRDHPTIMHGRDKLASLRQSDRALDEKLKKYEAHLTASPA